MIQLADRKQYFPLSSVYKPIRTEPFHLLKESRAKGRSFGYSERHLQAVWFDPKWRPHILQTNQGEIVEVEFPGRWNLDAGPDFIGATLRVGPDKRRISGDVEIHIYPADWNHHRHQFDSRYQNVCAHVTYFEGHLEDDVLPAGALQLSLRAMLKTDPTFAFEHIDIAAYPYAGRADIPPCRNVLSAWPVEHRQYLLTAAGHERMRIKSGRFAEAIAERGADQVLYESFMAVLGYQHNKQPFQDLASRIPVEQLRVLSGGDSAKAYALLAGMSGLLPLEIHDRWDEETRLFIRSVWDVWWKFRHQLPEPKSRAEWHLNGLRPLNHPLRRMMAAATIFAGAPDALTLLVKWFDECLQQMMPSIDQSETGYWTFHSSLGGARNRVPVAILGRDRMDALVMNIVIPMASASGFDPSRVHQLLESAKPEPVNRIMREAAFYLFGADHPSSNYRTAVQRQGLLQIFHDYCINDRSRCSGCVFPGMLNQIRPSVVS